MEHQPYGAPTVWSTGQFPGAGPPGPRGGTLRPMTRLPTAVLLGLVWTSTALAQPPIEEIREHIVVVRSFDAGGRALGDISGFAVGDGRVLSAAAPLLDADELLVVLPEAGDEVEAEVVALDERSGIALLRTGDGAPRGLAFVAPGVTPSEGDIVHLPRFAADGTLEVELDRGAVAALDRLGPTAAGEPELLIFRHGAPAVVPQYGMPLLNDCGALSVTILLAVFRN